MNAVEIEEASSNLAEQPFDSAEFPYAFLLAFGNKATTIKRLRTGALNKSDLSGVLQTSNIHLKVCTAGEVTATLAQLKASPATAKAKAKFILATDGTDLEAEDLTSGETIACAYTDFPNHFGFFLPLAGISIVKQIRERLRHQGHWAGRMLGEYIGPGESDYTRYDEAVVARAEDWFKSRANGEDGRDWCLYVGLVAPHFPLVSPEPFFSRYREMDMPEPKMRPGDGYRRHPWVSRQNDFQDNEALFKSEDERQDAIAAYWGLCEWMDHNVGRILKALEDNGLEADVIYASDHGDNVGARGLWGKSNTYRESVSVPLIAAVEGISPGKCDTPVSLLDLAETIPSHFGLDWQGDRLGRPLQNIAAEPSDPEREIISQPCRWRCFRLPHAPQGEVEVEYAEFQPELFDLSEDPEELANVVARYPSEVKRLAEALRKHVLPEATEVAAFAAQDKLIQSFGGIEAALKIGGKGGGTSPPRAKGSNI